jgi:hypothetical protein
MPISVVDGDTYDPPETAEPDCEWPIVMRCDPSVAFTPETVELAQVSAAEIMDLATARRFGVCTSTFAPGPPAPAEAGHVPAWDLVDPKISYDANAARWNQFYDGGNPGNARVGICPSEDRIKLWHRRVVDVVQVVVDGAVLDPTAYHLEGQILVRDDGNDWPSTQGERYATGSWEITYRHGIPVPKAGQVATGILACEIALALDDDDDCSLPARTKTYTNHAGVTVGFIDPMEFLEDGMTGLYVPDQWIRRVNPHGLDRRARAFSFRKNRRHALRLPNPSIFENLEIERGRTFSFTVRFWADPAKTTPLDVSGRTFDADLVNTADTGQLLGEFAVDMTDAANGVVRFTLDDTITATIPSDVTSATTDVRQFIGGEPTTAVPDQTFPVTDPITT